MATPESSAVDAEAHDHDDADQLHQLDLDQALSVWRVVPETQPLRSPAVVEVDVVGHLIIAHATSPRVVRLDPINALLWRSFAPGVSVQDLADDLVDALGVDPDAAREMLTSIVTDLARAGFLMEPADLPSVRRPRFWPVDPESGPGRRLGLDRMGPENSFVIDLGPALLRPAATDLEVAVWLRERFADAVVPRGDPRTDDEIEMMIGVTGVPAANRRPRRRSTDHYGNVWFSTFDRAEHADALARGLRDRLDAAQGGTWLRLAALVADVPTVPGVPTPAVLIHPWGLPSLERLLAGLEHACVRVHPSPLLRYDPTSGLIDVAPSPRFPTTADITERGHLQPVALAGAAADDQIIPAELVERFGHAALHFDLPHLDAVARLVTSTPYRTVDAGRGLRGVADQLAALVLS